MEQSKFSFEVIPSNPQAQLGFEAWINDQCVFNTDHVDNLVLIEGLIPPDDVEAEHTLRLVLKGKRPEHTQIDNAGNITTDAVIKIVNMTFDEINLEQLVNQSAVYHHDFNGTQTPVTESFFGTLGCNGSAELKFTTPIYLWLLENM